MKKRTILAVISAILLLASCDNSRDPQWAIPENDLLIAFPTMDRYYLFNDSFRLDTLADKYLDNTDYEASDPFLADKIYFPSSLIEKAATSGESEHVAYSLFSVEYDGSGLTELFHDEYDAVDNLYDPYCEILGIYGNRVIYSIFGNICILDHATHTILFQSIHSGSTTSSTASVAYTDYIYLCEDKIIRLGLLGPYVVKWNAEAQAYEEVFYPSTHSYVPEYRGFIEGVVITRETVPVNKYDNTVVLKGFRYEDGTLVDTEECQALLDQNPEPEPEPEQYTIDRTEDPQQPLAITHSVTRNEDSLSRDLTQEYLVDLYPDLQKPYDTGEFVLYDVIQQGEALYLTFSYSGRDVVQGSTFFDRILFAYDFERETMTYLGFFQISPAAEMLIIDLNSR